MSLKFGEIKPNKKEFHRSKQPVYQPSLSEIVIHDDCIKNLLDTKMAKLLSHYVLCYLR